MTRKDILDAAARCVLQDRDKQYGNPEDNFGVIARLWSTYLDVSIDAYDVALLMSLMKIARAKRRPDSPDSLIDLAGYAACAGDIYPAHCAPCIEDPVE